MDERNFISSIPPKMARAVLPSTSSVSCAHSLSLAPLDRMGEIGFGLVQRGDREPDRDGALSEARDLGKDEPHPVAFLPPDLQLLANLVVDRPLRVDEAIEIERIPYPRLLKSPRCSKVAPNSGSPRLEHLASGLNCDRNCDRGAKSGRQYRRILTPLCSPGRRFRH